MSEKVAPQSPEKPHVVEIAMRWGDQDSLGHINNVQVARLLEEARVRIMAEWFAGRDASFGMLVARQEIEFAAILQYTVEPARIRVWVPRIGNSSFDFGYEVLDAQGTVTALAETTVTAVDFATGRPVPLPDDVRDVLREQSGDPVALRRRR